ncbi:MAG TPA: NAD(P)/FAD-dependent oxidoreductase [Thermomicrobiales bacterium]|nr:NAD(P)/FAD-dependent oxidoreductase [Thermomicrobiales bacterium]
MIDRRIYDVIIVGGGMAGATLAGVLARAGLGVLALEKEPKFRDRIRGEGTWPWGVAEAFRLDLGELLRLAGCVEFEGLQSYEQRQPAKRFVLPADSIDGLCEIGYFHPRFQEAAFTWAAAQGATMARPAKVAAFTHDGRPTATVVYDGREERVSARLVVAADGKLSMARRWTGGETVADPEHHRFGGVLLTGVRTDDRQFDNVASLDREGINWFAAGADATRLYLLMTAARVRETGVDRSLAAIVAYAAPLMPEGALDEAEQIGPIGYFPNNDIWASRIAGNDVALIGDAAGSPDPSVGHGTPLVFRDVRELSELLLSERDWRAAIAEYAARRERYFGVIREYDRWRCIIEHEPGPDADRLREGHQRAEQRDPTLGGFAFIEGRGPDGLVADEAARRMYFDEN